MKKKTRLTMKKISASVIILIAAMVLAVSCEKAVEPLVPEIKLIAVWKAPLTIGDEAMNDFAGKNLILNQNHTASFSRLYFNNWKIEGDQLTLTNYYGEGPNRHLEVLRYTINSFTDTTLLLTGRYIAAIGDSVYMEGDLSGLYKRDKNQVPQQ